MYPITPPEPPDWSERFVSEMTTHLEDLEIIISEIKKDYDVRGNQSDAYAVKNKRDNSRIYHVNLEKFQITTNADNGLDDIEIISSVSKDMLARIRPAFQNEIASFRVYSDRVVVIENFNYIYMPNNANPSYVFNKGDKQNWKIFKINDNWYYAIPETYWWW
jgi:hypothetical protein